MRGALTGVKCSTAHAAGIGKKKRSDVMDCFWKTLRRFVALKFKRKTEFILTLDSVAEYSFFRCLPPEALALILNRRPIL
jgi:hypothetical protein